MSENYVMVTTTSTFRIRYAVPVSELDDTLSPQEQKTIATQMVLDGEVGEFSQLHIGEVMIDVWDESQEAILERFDIELDYAARWTEEQKLQFIKNSVDSEKRGTNYA
jgi:hypothetical protein